MAIDYELAENIAAFAHHFGRSEMYMPAYRSAADFMGGFPGFYQASIEAAEVLSDYAKKKKIRWGEGVEWPQTIEEMGNRILAFMIQYGRLPDKKILREMAEISIRKVIEEMGGSGPVDSGNNR